MGEDKRAEGSAAGDRPASDSGNYRYITTEIVGEARKRAEMGESAEEILRYLHGNGADPIDSIFALKHIFGMSTRQAQEALYNSETWAGLRKRHKGG